MPFALSVTQPTPACSEHELVAWVRRGDDRAFEELYNRYRRRIGAYILGMVGDHGRAEDIAQEVFISALRRLRKTECPIAFKPWIYEIAKNACVDEFRRTRRAREVPLEPEQEQEVVALRASAGADDAIEGKQRLTDLRGAFHGLSESHHRIIVLRELEGRSYQEIGELMGISRPVVESTLFRARRRLGQEYDELVSGRRCAHVQAVIAADGERPLRSLGVRERRQLARHLAHCQPCRRHARAAEVDEQFFHTPGLVEKIAALLPIPWLRWRRGSSRNETAGNAGAHPVTAWTQLQSVAQYVDPTAPAFGFGRVVAAAAAIVIGGAGGGFVTGLVGNSGHASSGSVASSTRVVAAASTMPKAHDGNAAGPAAVVGSALGQARLMPSNRAAAASGDSGSGASTAAGSAQSGHRAAGGGDRPGALLRALPTGSGAGGTGTPAGGVNLGGGAPQPPATPTLPGVNAPNPGGAVPPNPQLAVPQTPNSQVPVPQGQLPTSQGGVPNVPQIVQSVVSQLPAPDPGSQS